MPRSNDGIRKVLQLRTIGFRGSARTVLAEAKIIVGWLLALSKRTLQSVWSLAWPTYSMLEQDSRQSPIVDATLPESLNNLERKRSCSQPVEQNLTVIPGPIVPFGRSRSGPERAVKMFRAARHMRH
jgi:hypothetical protein